MEERRGRRRENKEKRDKPKEKNTKAERGMEGGKETTKRDVAVENEGD